jgi:hypothetical protein
VTKIILAIFWVAGWVHVFFFSPEGGQSTADFISDVMQSGGGQVDPLVFTVFNLLGIWPLVMVAMLVQDEQGKLKAWPFAFSSMVLGNSALYIYLFFRKEQGAFVGPVTKLIKFAESKVVALFLLVATVALFVYGLSSGSPASYAEIWRTHFFVNVMTVDFFLFTLAFAVILPDDVRRRNMEMKPYTWLYALVPVLGATAYLAIRKPLALAEHSEKNS